MGTPFDRLMERADRQQLRVFGELEPVELLPRVRTQRGVPMPDIERTSGTVPAVFTSVSRETALRGQRGAGGGAFVGFTEIVETVARLWLPAASVRALGWVPGELDAVVARGGFYSIVRAEPSDLGDVILHIDPEVHPT